MQPMIHVAISEEHRELREVYFCILVRNTAHGPLKLCFSITHDIITNIYPDRDMSPYPQHYLNIIFNSLTPSPFSLGENKHFAGVARKIIETLQDTVL